jgi:3'(2'), 5'-bisphosphate nucleotidase
MATEPSVKQSAHDAKALVQELCALAEQAGVETMRFYGGRTSVTQKSDSSPLTDADRASHDFLMRALPGLMPGVQVISEESVDPTHLLVNAEGLFWLVDLLDGTKEFLKGTGQFTVNIALIEGRRPVAGVVHAPAIGITYFADLENGAFRKQHSEAPIPIRCQRANREHLRVVASKDHAGPLVAAMLARLPNVELKSMGSSLKFCLVAEGAADVYLRDVPTMEWDTTAAQCIVEAAGGKICTLDGQPLRYGKPGLKNSAIITIGDPDLPWQLCSTQNDLPKANRSPQFYETNLSFAAGDIRRVARRSVVSAGMPP